MRMQAWNRGSALRGRTRASERQGLTAHVGARIVQACVGYREDSVAIERERQSELIAELLAETAATEALGDAMDETCAVFGAQAMVFQPSTHLRAGAAMPQTLALGDDEVDASGDHRRIGEQESIGELAERELPDGGDPARRQSRRFLGPDRDVARWDPSTSHAVFYGMTGTESIRETGSDSWVV